jgi:putative flippase GtrA
MFQTIRTRIMIEFPGRTASALVASAPQAGPSHQWARLCAALLAGWARPLRFTLVGGSCGLLQLGLFVTLKALGLAPLMANVIAYLLSAQVNFGLSNQFIWSDRWSNQATMRDLLRRWLAFHASIAVTFVLSQATFLITRMLLTDVVASALGIGVAAIANFLIQDRLTFSRIRPQTAAPPAPAAAAPRPAPRHPRG